MSPDDTFDAARILRTNTWSVSNCLRYAICIECGVRHFVSSRNREHRKGCALERIVRTYRLPEKSES